MKNIIEALQWRYATKLFDPQRKLAPAQLDTLTSALRLSASSFGLQPWKFVIVTNPAIRAKLREAAWGQAQITDASHLIVFCVRKDIDDKLVDAYMASIAKARNMKLADLESFADSIKGSLQGKSPEARLEWGSRQVYSALGTLLASAASEGIDACPMEGFDAKKFDEILGLGALQLESRVLAAVGFRSEGDTYSKAAKARFPKDDIIIEVK